MPTHNFIALGTEEKPVFINADAVRLIAKVKGQDKWKIYDTFSPQAGYIPIEISHDQYLKHFKFKNNKVDPITL